MNSVPVTIDRLVIKKHLPLVCDWCPAFSSSEITAYLTEAAEGRPVIHLIKWQPNRRLIFS